MWRGRYSTETMLVVDTHPQVKSFQFECVSNLSLLLHEIHDWGENPSLAMKLQAKVEAKSWERQNARSMEVELGPEVVSFNRPTERCRRSAFHANFQKTETSFTRGAQLGSLPPASQENHDSRSKEEPRQ